MKSSSKKRPLRQLPPSAVPVTRSDILAGLNPSPDAHGQFINALSNLFGISKEACVLAASGRTALYYLLKGLHTLDSGRSQVIIPAYTCPALAKVSLDLGLTPVYVDIDPDTSAYQKDKLIAAVSKKTLAIVLVHPFGIPLPIMDIKSLAQEQGAVIIEDAAQSMGAKWKDDYVGTQGDFGLYSLGPGKPISTGGGGIVIVNDPQRIPALQSWWREVPPASGFSSKQAWLRQTSFQAAFHPAGWWAMTRAGLHRLGNHEASWGYALRDLTASQAAIGLALLPRLEAINEQRRQNAMAINRIIDGRQGLTTVKAGESTAAIYLRYPLLTGSEEQRDQLFNALWSAGIGAGRLYEKSLPAIYTPEEADQYPGAAFFAQRLLTLPTHHLVDERDLKTVRKILIDL